MNMAGTANAIDDSEDEAGKRGRSRINILRLINLWSRSRPSSGLIKYYYQEPVKMMMQNPEER